MKCYLSVLKYAFTFCILMAPAKLPLASRSAIIRCKETETLPVERGDF